MLEGGQNVFLIVAGLHEQGHPTKIICKMKNNVQKQDNETLTKHFFEFLDVAGRKKGVLNFQEDNEWNSSSQLDNEGNSQPADFVSLFTSQQIKKDNYQGNTIACLLKSLPAKAWTVNAMNINLS